MNLNEFCGTPFWNETSFWESESPYVSLCFQNLILVLGSCGVLWIIAPFDFIKICTVRGTPRPWTSLSISKLVLKILLLIICIVELTISVYIFRYVPHSGLDSVFTSTVYLLTILLTLFITMMFKKRGIPVSLALPSFWMASTITTLVSIYNDIHNYKENDWTMMTKIVDDSLSFAISLIQLILSNISEKRVQTNANSDENECPLENASLASRLTLSWILKLITKSTENSLHQNFLTPLCPELKSSKIAENFSQEFNRSHALIQNNDEEQNGRNGFKKHNKNVSIKPKSLTFILAGITRKFLILSFLFESLYTATFFLPPLVFRLLLGQTNEGQPQWHNYLYATALFIAVLLSSLTDTQRKYYALMAAIRIKIAVMNAVFEKAFKVHHQTENVKKLLVTDSNTLFQMICIMNEIWGLAARLIIGVYLLWSILGPACFGGIATAILLVSVHIIVDQFALTFKEKAAKVKKEGLEVLKEWLQGVKVLKLYAWEDIFLRKISSLRNLEISILRKATFIKMTFRFQFLSNVSLVLLSTFSAYALSGNAMDAQTIFVPFLLIHMLKTPFQSIFHLVSCFIQGLTSLSRTRQFLETEEISNNISRDEDLEGNSVYLTNASFSWIGMGSTCLQNLNLRIPKGSLIAVVGQAGSGKSSLLRALLGELRRIEGQAVVAGELAFVTEEAWIQNASLEKNIVFLKSKDPKIYQKILDACALFSDIENLPVGDETEIGEMGVHLSLEQKLKVELARAAYQNADIYLLDDPLKHLNASLADQLYHRVFGRSGLLKEKTRILVTSHKEFLSLVDHIIFLKEGRIAEQGTYSQLTSKEGHFANYLRYQNEASSSQQPTELFNEEHSSKHIDALYSIVVAPAKQELVNTPYEQSKELAHKLSFMLKTIGYASITLAVIFAGLACSCEVASGVWLSGWIDYQGNGKTPSENLIIYSYFILAQVFLTITCGIVLLITTTITAKKFHAWLLSHIIRACQSTLETTPTKKILDSFNKDFYYLDEKIPDTFYLWLMTIMKTTAFLVLIFVASPFLSILSVPLILAFFIIQKLYLNVWEQFHRLTSATGCPLFNLLQDSLKGASNIRATQSTPYFLKRFHVKMDTHNNCSFLFLLVSRWLTCSTHIIASVLVLLTTIMVFNEKDKHFGFIALAIAYSLEMANNLTSLAYLSSLIDIDLSSLERLNSFSQIKQESEWDDPANKPPVSWPDKGHVSIENLTTAGEGMYPVLHHINITIESGQKVAIIGNEQSGVSTLLYSLFRIIEPMEGRIVIDNIDISTLGLKDLRSKLAIISQETILLNGTIRQNLDPRSEFNDASIWSVLDILNMKTKVTSLDQLISTEMSSEDKYYISIARYLLKKPKIVIIEEPIIPNSKIQRFFVDSTVISFCDQPLPDYDGRVIKFLSGEIVMQDYFTRDH